ncbi:Phosphatidylglycerol/phosphatidylinositol transfer protein, partial [Cryomyces antarcticus]
GKNLTISARGTLSADIEDGAKVHLQVKYGLIRLINQEADLCETVKNVDLNCPLKKGEMELKKDVELPKEIPPGKYTVLADVFTKDGDKITCLTATVVFHR